MRIEPKPLKLNITLTLLLTIAPILNSEASRPPQEDIKTAKSIVVNSGMYLRQHSFFAPSTKNLGYMQKGTKAEVLSIDTDKAFGVGLQVRITEGPNAGEVGWVYYAKDPKNRTLDILDQDGEKYNIPFKNFFKKIKTQAKKIKERGYRIFNTRADSPVVIRESDDQIWDKIYSGEYQIDNESDQGGAKIPVKGEYIDYAGNRKSETIYVDRDIKRLMKLPSKIKEGLAIPIECLEKPAPATDIMPSGTKWIKGCEALGTKLSSSSEEKLALCMANIKKIVIEGAGKSPNMNRDVVFKNLYSKLNAKEQEFAAMTFTANGEAGVLAPPLEEMVMIMKVLNNRKNYAINNGYPDANELDAALQPWQFSMWNKNEKNWQNVLNDSAHSPNTRHSISAYIRYQNSTYESNAPVNKMYHYHTDYVTADWSDGKSHNPVKVNNKLLKQKGKIRHKFYANIAWSFKYNKTKKEHLAKK